MKDLVIWLFIVLGLVWLAVVEQLALKHFHQGGLRLWMDRLDNALLEPPIGQPRPWEPGERRELLLMRYGTYALLAAAVGLFLLVGVGR